MTGAWPAPATKKAKPAAEDRQRRWRLAHRRCAASRGPQGGAGPRRPNGWRRSAGAPTGKALKRLLAGAPEGRGPAARRSPTARPISGISRAPSRSGCWRCSMPIRTRTSRRCWRRRGKAVGAAKDEAEAMRLLRRMKAEAALLIALADIGGVWPVMRATRALTELADTAVGAAVRFLLRDAARARQAQARRSGQARGGQRLHRARHGQDGRLRAQLFERHRPDRVLRPGRAGAGRQGRRRRRSTCGSRAAW